MRFSLGLDFALELIESVELHDDHAGGDRRQLGEAGAEIFAATKTEKVTETLRVQVVAVDGGSDAVLESGAQIAQRHAGAEKFPLVAQRRGRNPHFWKRAAAQQQRETAGVDGIALVRFANALFRFQRIGEMRDVLGALHLVDDPIPVTGGLEGDVRVFGKLREKRR